MAAAAERPFCVMMVFAILLVCFSYSVGCVRIPEWTRFNTGLCALGVLFVGVNYVNEYLAKFPLSYRWAVDQRRRSVANESAIDK